MTSLHLSMLSSPLYVTHHLDGGVWKELHLISDSNPDIKKTWREKKPVDFDLFLLYSQIQERTVGSPDLTPLISKAKQLQLMLYRKKFKNTYLYKFKKLNKIIVFYLTYREYKETELIYLSDLSEPN